MSREELKKLGFEFISLSNGFAQFRYNGYVVTFRDYTSSSIKNAKWFARQGVDSPC